MEGGDGALGPGLSRRQSALLARLRDRKARRKEGKVLCEGVRGVREALSGRPGFGGVDFAVVSPRLDGTPGGSELKQMIRAGGAVVAEVPDPVLNAAADTEAPQGVLLVISEPHWRLDDLGLTDRPEAAAAPRLLLLDGVQDPGNAGTLLRTALAFGLQGALVVEGTVDPWNPKVVRAAAGAGFRLPVVRLPAEEAVRALAEAQVPLLATTLDGEAPWAEGVDPGRGGGGWCLAVGSEGHGVGPGILGAAHRRVTLPMPGAAESLNVALAGGILLHELTRRERGAP